MLNTYPVKPSSLQRSIRVRTSLSTRSTAPGCEEQRASNKEHQERVTEHAPFEASLWPLLEASWRLLLVRMLLGAG